MTKREGLSLHIIKFFSVRPLSVTLISRFSHDDRGGPWPIYFTKYILILFKHMQHCHTVYAVGSKSSRN
jgi:hypothetical protein